MMLSSFELLDVAEGLNYLQANKMVGVIAGASVCFGLFGPDNNLLLARLYD